MKHVDVPVQAGLARHPTVTVLRDGIVSTTPARRPTYIRTISFRSEGPMTGENRFATKEKEKTMRDKEKDTTNITAAVEEPAANRFTPDAGERIARLRVMGDEFPGALDTPLLTNPEIRLARGTTVAALEKAALLAEAAPRIAVAEVTELRDAIAFELAYGGMRDEALALARRVDMAILHRKLKAVKAARGLYRVAKGYITLDAGGSVRPHVTEMKRSLLRRRRKPARKNPFYFQSRGGARLK
jgi:hypothetical protein